MENLKETKTFKFEIKNFDDAGRFTGYLSTFGNVDSSGDIVERGAFRKTLKETRAFPLIWSHEANSPDKIVGAFTAREDEHGLWIEGEFFDDEESQKARRKTIKLYERGIKMGLSMGYQTVKFMHDTLNGKMVRRLQEVRLLEGSLTLWPMNEMARVEAVKAEWDVAFINSLPDAAFAVIEPAYERGDTEDKRARHLPHHNKNVKSPTDDDSVDLPHLRNALARMNQIKPVTSSISVSELRKKAAAHLIAHAKRLGVGEWDEAEPELKPYPNEHSARLRSPDDFDPDTFRRKNDGTIYGHIKVPSTVAVIWGKLKTHNKPSDSPIPQSLRFPVDSWTVDEAKKWLKDNNINYLAFESASKASGHFEPEPPTGTQSAKPSVFARVIEVLERKQAADEHLLSKTLKILEKI